MKISHFKYFIIFLIIFFNFNSFLTIAKQQHDELPNFHSEFDGDYAIKGKDSIKIINMTMRYALSWSFKKINFESNTFCEYKDHSLKKICDSLKSQYLLMENYYIFQYFHDTFKDSGFVVCFYFLIDSLNIYSFNVYSNDSLILKDFYKYMQSSKNRSKDRKIIVRKLLNLKTYGLLTYKDSDMIINWKEQLNNPLFKEDIKKDRFYKEYLKLLRKIKQKLSKEFLINNLFAAFTHYITYFCLFL